MGIWDVFTARKARTIQSLPAPPPQAATVDADYLAALEDAVLGSSRRAAITSLAGSDASRSSYAQVCAHKVAEAGSSVAMTLEMATPSGTWTTVYESTSRAQRMLQRPNRYQPWPEFVRAALGVYQTAGRVFIFAHRDKLGDVRDLVIERPEVVTVSGSPLDGDTIYTVQRASGRVVYGSKDVIIWSYPDLFDPLGYTSPWKIAVNARTADAEAELWQRESMAVRVVPDVIVQLARGTTAAQAAPIVEGMRARKRPGGGRQSLVVDHEVAVHSLNPGAIEVDFLSSRSSFQEQISAAFGVPRPLLGILENATLANLEASEQVFWTGTVLPYLRSLAAKLSEFLTREFGVTYRVTPDESSVPALRLAAVQSSQSAATYHGMGVPFDVINDRLRLGFPAFEGSDQSLLPSGLVTAAAVADGSFGMGQGLGPLPGLSNFGLSDDDGDDDDDDGGGDV